MPSHSIKKNKQHLNDVTQQPHNNKPKSEDYDMAKLVAIISYFTLLGWLVAIALYGKHKSTFTCFHLRQSLGLIITGALLSFIPLIGWSLNFIVILAWLYALFYAIQGQQQKVPLLGIYFQEHLDFIN